jgi:hypothetical protein
VRIKRTPPRESIRISPVTNVEAMQIEWEIYQADDGYHYMRMDRIPVRMCPTSKPDFFQITKAYRWIRNAMRAIRIGPIEQIAEDRWMQLRGTIDLAATIHDSPIAMDMGDSPTPRADIVGGDPTDQDLTRARQSD